MRISIIFMLCFATFCAHAFTTAAHADQTAPPAQKASQVVGPDALWQPGMQTMQTIREECNSSANFGECFASGMQKSGASPQAVAFTKRLGDTGYLRDFRETGRVDVAYVYYLSFAKTRFGFPFIVDEAALRSYR